MSRFSIRRLRSAAYDAVVRDRHVVDAVAVVVGHPYRLGGHGELREGAQELREEPRHLEASKVAAQAFVDAVPKSQVLLALPGDVEAIWILPDRLVPVARGGEQDDPVPCPHLLAAELQVLVGHPKDGA